jgi:class 3 adenylate cyclase/tetratricopeptide (TPR) repeat protein
MATASEEVLEGTVTVLFTDVQGSTEMRNQRGDEAAASILRVGEDLVRGQIEAHSGREVKALGDGFMVAFGSARKAVSCAVAIQKAMHEHNHANPGREVHVRIGLNSGEVSQQEGDLFGAAVNLAARVAAKARGDQILVSGVVKQLAGRVPEAGFVDRGRFRLKGFDERWQLFEVTWEHEDGHRAAAAAALTPARTPLIGRAEPQAELLAALDLAASGRGSMVMIGGEPGVGKTRLCDEILAEARKRGFLTLVGHCYESQGSPPYIPFVEMVESAIRQVDPGVLREHLGDSAGEVARLVPELRRQFPDIPPALELPPEQERRHIYNSCRDFVARAAGSYPICVLLDDLHWADEGSLLLVDRFAEDIAAMRVMVLGTYRDVELDLGRPLARTLDGLVRQRRVHRVSLRRLPESDVAAMLEALGGRGAPAPLVEAIYRETEGNPFFVEEIFKHLAESGQLFDTAGGWLDDLHVAELDVPESVRLVLGRRLERLSEESRRALSAAAVIGRSFSFALINSMGGGLNEDALLDALDEGERAGLLTSIADGPQVRFTFGHELIRQTLLTGLTVLRRQRLHLRVAEAMEMMHAGNLDEHAGDIAGHLLQAGLAADAGKAARFLRMAGDRAQSAAAFEEALRNHESGLAIVPPDDRQDYAWLKAGQGKALRALGRWDEAHAAWSEAIDIFQDLGLVAEVGELCDEQAFSFAWAQRWEEALLVAGRGLAVLGEKPTAPRVRLLGLSGVTLSVAGNYGAGAEMTGEALSLAEQLDDPAASAYSLGVRAIHHWAYMELSQAIELGLRSDAIAKAMGLAWRRGQVGVFVAMALRFVGREDEALALLDEIEPALKLVGHAEGEAFAARVRMFAKPYGPDRGALLENFAREDEERVRRLPGMWLQDSYTLQALGQFWQGRWEEAEVNLLRGLEYTRPWTWTAAYPGLVFLTRAYLGHREEAMAMLPSLEAGLPTLEGGHPLGAWDLAMSLVEGFWMLGERQRAHALYPIVTEPGRRGARALYGSRLVEAIAVVSAAAGRDWDAAGEHFELALAEARRTPNMVEEADAFRFRAMMLTDRGAAGDMQRARADLEAAQQLYEVTGMPRHIELARGLLDRS